MRRAIRLAEKGAGRVNPNPMVGAVLVSGDRILAQGYHRRFGGPHAEAELLSSIITAPKDAILFVNLEPCNHQGKTPPCAPLIVEKGIRKVVVGTIDPDPLVNGKGISYLRDHGVDVEAGILSDDCRTLNESFIKFRTTGMPFVVLKWAMTLDGKIATVENASRWITGEDARKEVHRMRQKYSAVMVGVNTVIADDPLLNVRLRRNEIDHPLKVITDTRCRIPLESKVLTNDPQLTILAVTDLADKIKVKEVERLGAQVVLCPVKYGRVDLDFLMKSIAAMGIDSVMLEGGSTLTFSMLREKLVDKIVGFVAPKIIGGSTAPSPVGGEGIPVMEDAIEIREWKTRSVGEDIVIEGYIVK
ncbi:MAG: bifunctional diaminohydroxyphosphoribosylaminopyrimidine deaminase/5-amino-6-(5-phosphoribosylamino)uracil reductase RibD [bacterium]